MKRLTYIYILVLVAAVFTSCSETDETFSHEGPVRVDLNFIMSGSTSSKTRMSDAVVQNSTARNYDILQIIPMTDNTPDIQTFSNQTIVNKTAPRADFHHFGNCEMSVGVNKCIVYAKAQAHTPSTGVSPAAHNGSLSVLYDGTPYVPFPEFTAGTDLSKLYFSPVSMMENTTAPTEAHVLATFLTNIANASLSEPIKTWQSSNDPVLKIFFKNFISEGNDIPGSAANVKEWANQLKTALNNQTFEDGSDAKNIRDQIVTLCDATTVTYNGTDYSLSNISYPRNYDLPDGAAVLRWNATNKAFEPKTETTTVNNINTITRFAYPPELYYFVESAIRCKSSLVDYQSLYASKDTWDAFMTAAFPESETESEVSSATHSVALTSPVQYAVAQLKVTVRASAASLQDGMSPTPNSVAIGTTNFPLTGVIVGGQRHVNYKFQQEGSGEASIKFVFDSQVKTNSDDYYYLANSATAPANGPVTLVYQSYDGENVPLILEFENRSGQAFYGVDQKIVYPNTRFYLVGTISAPTYDNSNDYTKRVFTQDYTTTVNAEVTSLAGAYNVLPNILSSNLEIGVETTPQWIAATPTTVVME